MEGGGHGEEGCMGTGLTDRERRDRISDPLPQWPSFHS